MTTTERPMARPAQSAQHGVLREQMAYARELAPSNMLPEQYRNKPENVLWAIGYAEMLGLHAMAVINGMHNMQGKPTASAAFITMLVRRSGHRLAVYTRGKGDQMVAVAELTRADAPERTFTVEWTWQRAQKAKLTKKSTWDQFPEAMLKARASTEVARDNASDSLFGILYTPEELGADNTDEDGMITADSLHKNGRRNATQQQAAPGQQESEPQSSSDPEPAQPAQAPDPQQSEVASQKWENALTKARGNEEMLKKLYSAVTSSFGESHEFTKRVEAAVLEDAESIVQEAKEAVPAESSADPAEEFDWEGAIDDAERDGDRESLQIYVDTLESQRGPDDVKRKIALAALRRLDAQQPSAA